jgi:hypothetical protein
MKEFKGIEGVREIVSEDGYYRYITGAYNSFINAKKELTRIIDSGYKDAFIRDLNLLINK